LNKLIFSWSKHLNQQESFSWPERTNTPEYRGIFKLRTTWQCHAIIEIYFGRLHVILLKFPWKINISKCRQYPWLHSISSQNCHDELRQWIYCQPIRLTSNTGCGMKTWKYRWFLWCSLFLLQTNINVRHNEACGVFFSSGVINDVVIASNFNISNFDRIFRSSLQWTLSMNGEKISVWLHIWNVNQLNNSDGTTVLIVKNAILYTICKIHTQKI